MVCGAKPESLALVASGLFLAEATFGLRLDKSLLAQRSVDSARSKQSGPEGQALEPFLS